ncbi:conserved unknown protein [Ectocarpus siliculosus]|uniref:C3HC-type domain-containing protein n=1 Tax=Ectocarpus siliculosus TaxID=2880 RepID=D8LF30_ECTSI|nr:conserved unknown protein [Ectocarpus siliculosus]|eukprot:CBN79850.1 conserved unknown protein [Ectocarpus siliculosus]
MPKDLEEKVVAALARFDTAVRQANPIRLNQQQEDPREIDVLERIAAEADGARPLADKPTCRPWDYESFKARLATFTPLNWFSKPAFASPAVCARYGWINTGRDTLSCQCCSAQLRFADQAAGSDGNAANDDVCGGGGGDIVAVVEPTPSSSFSSRLQSQHHDLCPWNGNACPREFLQLPPMAVEDQLADFLARLDSLLPVMRAAALPEVSLPSTFEQHCPGGLSALAAKAMPSVVETREETSENRTAGAHKRQRSGSGKAAGSADNREMLRFGDEMLGTAAAIAMFGWQSAPATVPVSACAAVSPTEGSSSNGSTVAVADGGARATAKSPARLSCALCKRRLVTDNFLTLEAGPSSGVGCTAAGTGAEESPGVLSSPEGRGGSGRSGKRRRLSGGGTPLKPMDLAVEHRSFCPWAAVHPPVAGEEAIEGAVPGWRLPLEAVLGWQNPSKQEQVLSTQKERGGFSDAANGEVEGALQKVQKVLGVLMRY